MFEQRSERLACVFGVGVAVRVEPVGVVVLFESIGELERHPLPCLLIGVPFGSMLGRSM